MEQNWDDIIKDLPGASFLQTKEWASIKEPLGWTPDWVKWSTTGSTVSAAAMLLFRSLHRLPFRIAYVPRGPLVDWSDSTQYIPVLEELTRKARENQAIFLKIDPDLPVGEGIPGADSDRPCSAGLNVKRYMKENGWQFSTDQIQFRNTIEIDISLSDDELLKRMHPKTRYNIRLAEKKGVIVSPADVSEWPELFRLYSETADRDGFVIRPWEYYQRTWSTLTNSSMANCLKAEVDGSLVAAIWVVGFGKKAHYLYGMSSRKSREYMPNHLLQWRGIQLARSQGRQVYDMWGAPNEFDLNDSLSGVFRFKQGFGGKVIRTLGAWDFPIQPVVYRLYISILPAILNIMRSRGKTKTKQLLSA